MLLATTTTTTTASALLRHTLARRRGIAATSAALYARRRTPMPSGSAMGDGGSEPSMLTGDPAVDGLSRFDLDVVETAQWVSRLLIAMRDDPAGLRSVWNDPISSDLPVANPGVPSSSSSSPVIDEDHRSRPLIFRYLQHHTYDFSVPPKTSIDDANLALLINVARLNLPPQDRHNLILIAGDMYNPYEDTVTISLLAMGPASTMTLSMGKLELLNVFERLVNEAKAQKDALAHMKVDLRHVKPQLAPMSFPEQWNRPGARARSSSASSTTTTPTSNSSASSSTTSTDASDRELDAMLSDIGKKEKASGEVSL